MTARHPQLMQMSAVETGQMSAAATGQMSAVETRQMTSIETGLCTISIFTSVFPTTDSCPVSAADIYPVSTEGIHPVSAEDIAGARRRPVAVLPSAETG